MNRFKKRHCRAIHAKIVSLTNQEMYGPFITRSAPEIALVAWKSRDYPTTGPIEDEPNMVCDQCNRDLDCEPYVVVDWPNEDELSDPEYEPIGSYALCQSCAREFYNLTKNDVNKVDRIWLFYNAKRLRL